ncbi:MAG: hypothetical protein NVS3B16_21960 [Vulcanimicrobiaceae bacterium]
MYVTSASDAEKREPSPQLNVFLLGEPSVSFGGERTVDVPMPWRCVTLLAHLVLECKTRLRERVAASLWPDMLDCEARAALRRTLHDLLRALPKTAVPWIVSDAKRIVWNPAAPVWCDAHAFERLIGHVDTRPAAVRVYSGDLLAGEDADWVVEPRTRLRERLIEALAALAESCIASGDTTHAAGYYRSLLALEPFREDVFRALMTLYYANGDRARVACEYRRFVNKLDTELGIDPMPETIACYGRLVCDGRERSATNTLRSKNTIYGRNVETALTLASV